MASSSSHEEIITPESVDRAYPATVRRPLPPASGLRILYSGPRDATCLQRAGSLRNLGARVVHVRSGIPAMTDPSYPLLRVANRIKRHPDIYFANSRLVNQARRGEFDLVWIDKGLWLRPRTLRRLRVLLPRARFVGYSPDDMGNPSNQSRRYLDSLPLYDLHVTTKSYNVEELSVLGAREMLYVDNAYDPSVHRPLELTDEERAEYGADIGFVGCYEGDRAEKLFRLAEAGLRVTVRGPEWDRYFDKSHPNLTVLDGYVAVQTYARVVNATRINLGFLTKANRDQQTTRSIEIPACRSFMLAERTEEHQRLFREGIEAEFFEGFEELLVKCRHYLAHEDERRRIAENGHRRCVLGSYSNEGRLRQVVERAMEMESSAVPEIARGEPIPIRPAPLKSGEGRPHRGQAPLPADATLLES